ncbi:MAG: protein phosphatase 2C domain-containing protein [Proteobacteria bacterium]|nr:protein phosphatase 2C domain-containing protein [Pseudomonadota bacterium]
MVVIESAAITDVGQKRTGNEDALYLNDDLKLYLVSDGMGGHLAGEVASGLVADTIRDYMKRFQEEGDVEEMEDPDETLSKEANRLLSSINLANKGVHEVAQSNENYRGMGATISAAFFTDDTLIVANVGDSPVYLVHDGGIELLSVTHNVISEQMAINPEAAKKLDNRFRHMLTRAMGIEETVQADVCEIQYFDGDVLTISSDGLSDKVSPEEILDVVKRERPEKACQTLVNLANERGGDDNITVIVLKIRTEDEKGGIMRLISRLVSPFKKIFN